MTRGATPKSNWPRPVDVGDLDPEQRVEIMFEMSTAMGEIVLGSIRDKHPGISESALLSLARRRFDRGRRLHRQAVDLIPRKSSSRSRKR